jgi:hypothetical protein
MLVGYSYCLDLIDGEPRKNSSEKYLLVLEINIFLFVSA